MVHIYLDPCDNHYVVGDPDSHLVGLWHHSLAEALSTFLCDTTPDRTHTMFAHNSYTLISTHPSSTTLQDLQSIYPEHFI